MVLLDQGGRGRSALKIIAPTLGVGDVVEHLWIQRYPAASSAPESWRIVADDAPYLIGQCTSSGVRVMLVGARTTYLDVDVSARCFTVGVRLRPGVLPRLFGIPADELTNRSARLADVLGRVPACTYDALAAADAPAAIQALTNFLAARAQTSQPVDHRIATLVQAATGDCATVRDTVEELDLSDRTVRYWSQQQVGMGMKRLWRIRRLHHALHLGLQQPGAGWAWVAAEAGYVDQSHLIRDCQAFLGESPAVFAARGQS